jgi:hypothetical protein
MIKDFLARQFKEPGEDFTRLILKSVYDGKLPQQAVQRFEPIVRRSMSLFIAELVSDKLKSALQETEKKSIAEPEGNGDQEAKRAAGKEFVTTEEEIEAFVLTRMLLKDSLGEGHQLTYKDTASYFNILLDNNVRKWICRLYLSSNQKVIQFRDGEKAQLETVQDIEKHKEKLVTIVQSID